MVGVGVGLVVILSAYLVIMTHKVAGPLYKVSMYFDRMAEGRLGNVTRAAQGRHAAGLLRQLPRDARGGAHTRCRADVITMESAAARAAHARPASDAKLAEALDALDKHLTQRKKQLL